jgi:glutamate-1-semialdehyde aminotransferase
MAGFNDIMQRNGLAARLSGIAPMPQLRYPEIETRAVERLFSAMVQRGYFIHPIRPWFVSYAHDSACIERTLASVGEAAQEAVSA